MKYIISNKVKRDIINELGEEYKDIIIEKVLADTMEVDVDQVNVAELMRIDVSVKTKIRQEKRVEKRNRLFRITTSIGLLYTVFGFTVFIFRSFERANITDNVTMIGLLLSVFGMVMSALSMLMKTLPVTTYISRKHYTESDNMYEIINEWKEIEALLKELVPEKAISYREMANVLVNSNMISTQDADTIIRLLSLRNTIVHEKEMPLSNYEIRRLLSLSNQVIEKLRRIL